MDYPLFIAHKIYNGRDKTWRVSKPTITTATIGVTINLVVMIVSVCAVLGFKHIIRDRMVGPGSHVIVASSLTLQGSEQYLITVNNSLIKELKAIPGTKHVQCYVYTQGIPKTDSDFLGIMLKSAGPDFDSTLMHNNMVERNPPHFFVTGSQQRLVVSKTIADKLNLKVGQRFFVYFTNDQGIRTHKFIIAGIYEANMKRSDSQICSADSYTVNGLDGWGAGQHSGVELFVDDFPQLNNIIPRVLNKVENMVDHHGETYSAGNIIGQSSWIFPWFDLVDLNVWITLALMVVVAGVTMISGLLITILKCTQMIGVLRALGLHNRQMRRIFLWFATFITGRGLPIGNIIGLGIIFLQKWARFIRPDPQTYYVSTVPIEVSLPLITALNLMALLACVAVLIVSGYLISRIHPAKSIYYE